MKPDRKLIDEIIANNDAIEAFCNPGPGAPAWDGSGLPPVGVECEFESYQGGYLAWKPCRVIAHDGNAAVINYKNNYSAHGAESFRPIKTPEQLAAEQRERAIAEMAKVLPSCRYPQCTYSGDGSVLPSNYARDILETLHDHGWTKHDK